MPQQTQADSADGDTLAAIIHRNIETLEDRRRAREGNAGFHTRAVERITRFIGSMTFVTLNLALVVGWAVFNSGLIPGRKPEPLDLATVVGVEAIFLSTFVLISQNNAAEVAEKRAKLNLQINLLAEHEITRLLQLNEAIARKLGVDMADHPELDELQREVSPEAVLMKIEESAQ